ncbi:hypothetical protein ACA910_017808 [Epithemia clementina (nom. ined.)]
MTLRPVATRRSSNNGSTSKKQRQSSPPCRRGLLPWLLVASFGLSANAFVSSHHKRSSRAIANVAFSRTPTALNIFSLKENVEKWNRIWTDDNDNKKKKERYFPFKSFSTLSIPSIDDVSDEALGLVALGTVPILWGTYGPIVRSMYELEIPVPGFVFSSCYFSVAALTTVALALSQDQSLAPDSKDGQQSPANLGEKVMGLFSDTPTLLGGIELGFYVLVANCFHVVGLETVSSDKAGFLIQMTTVLVPLVSALMARDLKAVDGRTWIACCLAFVGIVTMNVDPTQDSALSILSSFSGGEGLVIGAALMYSFNVIRISHYADKTNPLRLTAVKATVEALFSLSIVAGSLFMVGDGAPEIATGPQEGFLTYMETTGHGVVDFYNTFSQRMSEGTLPVEFFAKFGGAMTWCGLMCTAAVVAAQSYGQRLVKPSDANLIYSLQPIFTACFASLLLGEQMDTKGFLGGGIILSAVLMVATKNMGNEQAETNSVKQ